MGASVRPNRRRYLILAAALFASSVVGVSPAQAAPTVVAPTNLRIEKTDTDRVKLTWTDRSNNETGFVVQRRPKQSATWTDNGRLADHRDGQPLATGWQEYTYRTDLVTPAVVWCYRVRAESGSVLSGPSNEVCGAVRRPSTPTNLQTYTEELPELCPPHECVALRWTRSTSYEDYYNVRITRQNGDLVENFHHFASCASPGACEGTTKTGHVWDLEPMSQYCFEVWAENPLGGASTGYTNRVCTATGVPPAEMNKPELAFHTWLFTSPTWPRPGQSFVLTWIACNYGGQATGNFTDVAQLDGGVTYPRAVSSLAPGACYSQSVSHPGLPAGSHHWYVYLDANGQVDEEYEGNNWASYGQIIS
jgi:CARDB